MLPRFGSATSGPMRLGNVLQLVCRNRSVRSDASETMRQASRPLEPVIDPSMDLVQRLDS